MTAETVAMETPAFFAISVILPAIFIYLVDENFHHQYISLALVCQDKNPYIS
jgi:hypothetical protein